MPENDKIQLFEDRRIRTAGIAKGSVYCQKSSCPTVFV